MKILLPAAEVAPIIKIGGLGDVVGSLPKALEKLDVVVDVIVPYYPFAKTTGLDLFKLEDLNVPFAESIHNVEVFNTTLPGSNVRVLLLKNEKYFVNYGKVGKITDVTELETFSFFCKAVAEYIKTQYNTYDLIHCNDWHTGLLIHMLSDELPPDSKPATLFTIHNLLYQGIGDPNIVREIGFVPGSHPLIDYDIADGNINFMQQGISSADFINTVSKTYANEILTPEFGGEMTDILTARTGRLTGILNGIDYSSFPRSYDISNWKTKKPEEKKSLCSKINLTFKESTPIFSYVGRLDAYQKGLDILMESIPHIIEQGGNFVILGDGDEKVKKQLIDMSNDPKYAGKLSVSLKFDADLAISIYSGSDYLVVPSRYEPCGLIQMLAMWYGTVPIAHATGGLADSIIEGKTGLLFKEYSTKDLLLAIDKAFSLYNGQALTSYIENDLVADFSWTKSALEYKDLYTKIIQLVKNNRA